MSQTKVSVGNRTHDPHANSLAHYPLDYQGTLFSSFFIAFSKKLFSGPWKTNMKQVNQYERKGHRQVNENTTTINENAIHKQQ